MAAGPPPAALRRILESRFSQLSGELEGLLAETRRRSRDDLAEQLNQAVRRLRQAAELDELTGVLADAAGALAGGAAVFRIEDAAARGDRIRGVPEETAEGFHSQQIALSAAAALAGAVESRDRLVAATTASEVSPELMRLLDHPANGRVSIFPLVVREEVPALLYTWGEMEGAALELLALVAASTWSALTVPTPPPLQPAPDAPQFVQIAAAAATPPKPAAATRASTWEQLAPEEQQVHLRAQRFARVHTAEMRLQQADAVQAGRVHRDLYGALQPAIDAARERFRQSFFANCPSMVDYLHLELVRTLSNDDPELLGKNYPGPMV